MKTTKALFGAALTTLLAGSVYANEHAATKPAGEAVKGQCHGINACKGQGECGGAGHNCAGKNECKGKGWVFKTEAECKDAGGTFKEDGGH